MNAVPNQSSWSINPDFTGLDKIDFDKIDFDMIDKCKHKEKEVFRQRLCIQIENEKCMALFIAIICLNCGRSELISEEIINRHLKGKKGV